MKRETQWPIKRGTKFGPALIVAFAVGVIGCGGGGGGGSTASGPVITGGSSSGGGTTATTGGATTGEITTGGTSGSSVTTGSSGSATTGGTDSSTTGSTATGSTTGSTDGSTTGSATGSTATGSTTGSTDGSTTTGSTATGSTTGSTDGSTTGSATGSTTGSATGSTTGSTATGSTTGSATGSTTGSATGSTTGSTATGSTTGSTDGSTTTGSTATGSTTGSTDGSTTGSATGSTTGSTGGGGPVSGLLRSNAIYFGHWTDGGIITSILPDGTGRQDVNDSGSGAIAATADPDNAGKMIYASYVDTAYAIYRGASFDISTSTALTPASYDFISTLHPTANGDVMMVAGEGGSSYAYILSGGSVQRIDEADGGAVTIDGTKVAYTKIVDGFDNLYVWDRGTNTSRLVVSGGDSLFPSFSKDGAWILFSSNRDGTTDTPWDLYQVPTAGGTIERITNTPTINEFGACYNEARTMVSYVGQAATGDLTGVWVLSNTSVTQIATDWDANLGTYWTTSAGRSGRPRGARFQRLTLPKNLKKSLKTRHK